MLRKQIKFSVELSMKIRCIELLFPLFQLSSRLDKTAEVSIANHLVFFKRKISYEIRRRGESTDFYKQMGFGDSSQPVKHLSIVRVSYREAEL